MKIRNPALFAFVLAGSACTGDREEAALPPAPPASPAQVALASRVDGLRFLGAANLPRAPRRVPASDNCSGQVVDPTTDAGRHAAALGWHVSNEVPFGRYVAVSIFSDAGDGTSGSCLVADGSVVVYEGARVVAVVVGGTPEEGTSGDIGGVMATPLAERARIRPGAPGAPVADLLATADGGIEIVPFPSHEPACDGTLSIPLGLGQPIAQARVVLLAEGWEPIPVPTDSLPDPGMDSATPLREAGIVEVQGCSGTGFGYCEFAYRHAEGPTMSVTSIGEEYAVLDYEVDCVSAGD